MLQFSKYFNYLYYDFGNLYSITQKSNWFYLAIQDNATEAYYAKLIKTKDQVFDIFQILICQAEC